VLYAILDCTGRGCDAQYEAWAEADQLDDLMCEVCGGPLEAVAYADAEPTRSGRPDVQLREVA